MGCDGQFLMQAVKDVYEVDASGARVANRSASDVVGTTQGSWATSASTDLSSSTAPPVNASSATFTAPFKPSPPPCPAGPAALAQPQPSDGRFSFTVLLFANDTNFTASPGQAPVEALAGNVKTTLDISRWPFCAGDHQLVVELALKSTKLGSPDAPRPPLIRNGSEAEQEAEQLARQLYNAVGALPAGPGEQATSASRRLLGSGDGSEGGSSQQDGQQSGRDRPLLTRWQALLQLPLNMTLESVGRAMDGAICKAHNALSAANATRSALVYKLARGGPSPAWAALLTPAACSSRCPAPAPSTPSSTSPPLP
ncbi:hypothetical protein ABPG77_006772 [Micractinium sp. CCAP 211/92]